MDQAPMPVNLKAVHRIEAMRSHLSAEDSLKTAQRRRKELLGNSSKPSQQRDTYKPPHPVIQRMDAREKQHLKQLNKAVRSPSYMQEHADDSNDCIISELNLCEARRRHAAREVRLSRHAAQEEESHSATHQLRGSEEDVATAALTSWYTRRSYEQASANCALHTEKTRATRRWRRRIALAAGVPELYAGNVHIEYGLGDTLHIFFGGIGSPLGPGHGHIVLRGGELVYQRKPYMQHGPQNHLQPVPDTEERRTA